MEDIFLRTFGSTYFRNTQRVMSDLYEYDHLQVYGAMTDDHIQGFVWMEHQINFSGVYLPRCRHMVGLTEDSYCYNTDLEEPVPTLRCGVFYQEDIKPRLVGDPTPELLIERDSHERIVFCGLHRDGRRHGPGSEFRYSRGITEIQGFWQDGVLTHIRKENSLVPIEQN
ncbi:MAG: hypothetical protein J6X88_10625 [Bacteroidales bacterium]|nr:hypothetical protein [Bacteroidales bacterium]